MAFYTNILENLRQNSIILLKFDKKQKHDNV